MTEEITLKGKESTWVAIEVPKDVYIGVVTDLDKKLIHDNKTNEDREVIEIVLNITDGDHKGKNLSYLCSTLISEKSKLGNLIGLATGEKVVSGKDYPLKQTLLGKKLRFFTDTKERIVNGNTVRNSFVKDVASKVA